MSHRTRNVLLGCGLIAVIVCVLACGAALWLGQDLIGIFKTALQAPYGIADRPLPTSAQAEVLLPPVVGSFLRGGVGSAASGELVATSYHSETTQVTITAGKFPSTAAAQDRVSQVEGETQGLSATRTYVTGFTDPSFVRASFHDGRVRFAWNHGAFFFDVEADSRAGLDAFMTSFPF